jgi:hypothetical protein
VRRRDVAHFELVAQRRGDAPDLVVLRRQQVRAADHQMDRLAGHGL